MHEDWRAVTSNNGKASVYFGAKSAPGSLVCPVWGEGAVGEGCGGGREVVRVTESKVPPVKWDGGSELKVSRCLENECPLFLAFRGWRQRSLLGHRREPLALSACFQSPFLLRQPLSFSFSYFLFGFRFHLFVFRKRGRGRERDGEK